jgi:hypothetical protein
MKLKRPVTITPSPIKLPNGSLKTLPTLVFDELDVTIIDNAKDKTVEAKFSVFPYTMVLWSGSFYDRIGDYTQKQVENKILETIGSNPAVVLKRLFLSKVISENKLPPVTAVNVFSSYFTTYSANSAFRANPTAFIRSLTSTISTVSGTSTFIPMITSNFMFPYSTFAYPVTAL